MHSNGGPLGGLLIPADQIRPDKRVPVGLEWTWEPADEEALGAAHGRPGHASCPGHLLEGGGF